MSPFRHTRRIRKERFNVSVLHRRLAREQQARSRKGFPMFSSWRNFPLFRSLQSLSRRTQAAKVRRRDRKVQLRVESLENRLVPSASSAISVLHATGQNQTTTEHDWYTVDQSTLQVVEFKETTRHNLP